MCAAQVVLTAYVIGCEVAFIYLFIREHCVFSGAYFCWCNMLGGC
jgi:hypothetical protein